MICFGVYYVRDNKDFHQKLGKFTRDITQMEAQKGVEASSLIASLQIHHWFLVYPTQVAIRTESHFASGWSSFTSTVTTRQRHATIPLLLYQVPLFLTMKMSRDVPWEDSCVGLSLMPLNGTYLQQMLAPQNPSALQKHVCYCDRKARAASAQSFTLWHQVIFELSRPSKENQVALHFDFSLKINKEKSTSLEPLIGHLA